MPPFFSRHPALVIGLAAGLLAVGVAFVSDANVPAVRAEGAPIRVATAVFAGGDFSSTEADLDKIEGVLETVVGFTGGTEERPDRRQVARGTTGHYEAVKVTYDPSRISYEALTARFLRTIDPTDAEGQFCDRGEPYRAALFVSGAGERNAAAAALSAAQRDLGKEVVTEIRPLSIFWAAEDSLQDYHLKSPARYSAQRKACGRDHQIADVWGTAAELTN